MMLDWKWVSSDWRCAFYTRLSMLYARAGGEGIGEYMIWVIWDSTQSLRVGAFFSSLLVSQME